MDEDTYNELYFQLNNLDDVDRLSQSKSINFKILMPILCLKLVRNTRKNFHNLKENALTLHSKWENGDTFFKLSEEYNFPPSLIVSIILQFSGMSKKKVRKLLKDPKNSSSSRITREVLEAIAKDFLYSPRAHQLQFKISKAGEDIIDSWLKSMNLNYITEKEMDKDKGTPDFILKEKLYIDGKKVSWIESKVVFADIEEHNRYINKQYKRYLNDIGDGMVVYWCGFLDYLLHVEKRIIIKDYSFFPNRNKNLDDLLNQSW
tara:strand:+ start:3740 stop:4522 length:783 start_codon:yes stop_codon:yes gene_type:complete